MSMDNFDNMEDEEFDRMMNEGLGDANAVDIPDEEEVIVEDNDEELDEDTNNDDNSEESEESESEEDDTSESESDDDENEDSDEDSEDDESNDEEEEDTDGDEESEQSDDDGEENEDDQEDSEDEDADEAGDSENSANKEPENETDNSKDATATTTPGSQDVKFKIKTDGIDYEFNEDEIKMLASKGLNYTKKTQEISKYRKQLSAIEENNITQDQLNLMIDAVIKGKPEALAEVMKNNKLDAMDIDTEKEEVYIPTEYSKSDEQIKLKDVVSKIEGDEEFTKTKDIVENKWDDQSNAEMFKDPRKILGLHGDIKSGLFDEVYPNAMKKKALDIASGMPEKTDLEYYIIAGHEDKIRKEAMALTKQENAVDPAVLEAQKKADEKAAYDAKVQEEAKKIADKRLIAERKKIEKKNKSIKSDADKRKAAGLSKKSGVTKNSTLDKIDSDKMDDDDFSRLMEKAIYNR